VSDDNIDKPGVPDDLTKNADSPQDAFMPDQSAESVKAEAISDPAAAVVETAPQEASPPQSGETHPATADTVSSEGEIPPVPAMQKGAPAPPKTDIAVVTADIPEESATPPVAEQNAAVLADSRKHTRRTFAIGGAAAVAAYGLYDWLTDRPRLEMQPSPFRRAFNANASLSRTIFDDRALTPTYPLRKAENLRVNGVYGLKMELVPESYRLQLFGGRDGVEHPRFDKDVTAWEYRYVSAASHEDQGHDNKTPPPGTARKMAPAEMVDQEEKRENRSGRMPRGKEEAGQSQSTLTPGTPGLLLTMPDVLVLPRHELVTQFKCIEGWSQIVHWAGVRTADFLDAYPPALIDGQEPKYVYMETPDGDYYTGYDLQVCRHPQTLLVTEMMGAPLTQYHGAPLRLHMPTKYGYKQIKRIGLISYTNMKPDDYWTKLGYDWYAGL
jgi:Oxidoreductase molybdopterin binding domain